MAEYIRYDINDGIDKTEYNDYFLINPVSVNLSEEFIKEYQKTINPEFNYFVGEE